MFYALTAEPGFYERHVSAYVALGPCALIGNTNSATSVAANNMYWIVESLYEVFDMQYVRHTDYYTQRLKKETCSYLRPFKGIAPNLCDWSLKTREEGRIYAEVTAGSTVSVRNLMHLAQNVRSKDFVEYDPDHSKKANPHSMSTMLTDQVNLVSKSVSNTINLVNKSAK